MTSEYNLASLWNPRLRTSENTVGGVQIQTELVVEQTEQGEVHVVEVKRFKGTFVAKMVMDYFPFDVQVD